MSSSYSITEASRKDSSANLSQMLISLEYATFIKTQQRDLKTNPERS